MIILGLFDKCAGKRDALLFTAGQLIGKTISLVCHIDDIQEIRHPLADNTRILAYYPERERDVFINCLVFEKSEILKNDTESTAQIRYLALRQLVQLEVIDC